MRNNILYYLILLLIITVACTHKKREKGNGINAHSAIEIINQKIDANPKDANLYNERAKIELEQKEMDNALKDINRALTINPKDAKYYCTLSDIYFAMGKVVNAGDALEKAVNIEPNNTEALFKIAELSFYFKKYDKTFEYLKKVLDIDKLNPKAYFMRGMAFKEYGDTAKAVADFYTATEQDPQYYDAYIQLGLLYSIKKSRLAIDYFNNALNIQPKSSEARYAKGMFYQETGDYNNAIATYREIIQLYPDNKYAYYNLGYIYLVYLNQVSHSYAIQDRRHPLNVAIDYFTKAIKCDAKYAEAYYNRGYCFELLGDINNARTDYKKSLEIKPGYEKAIDGLKRIN